MGGGEGSAAREALRHKSVEKVVMCDIDQEVVDFCKKHLTANHETFRNLKLDLVINDAKAELEERKEQFDIIVGDLADPVEGGPCYQLYTKSFYENILKPKLNKNGIFVTQAGPAGVFTHKEVFSSIYNTIKQVFKYLRAYTAHVPSFADTWGWVIASDHPLCIDAGKIDKKIADRIDGELLYLNGASFVSSTILNKTVAKTYWPNNFLFVCRYWPNNSSRMYEYTCDFPTTLKWQLQVNKRVRHQIRLLLLKPHNLALIYCNGY